jgi:hypothetical protein
MKTFDFPSASSGAQFAPKWDFMDSVVKRAFLGVDWGVVDAYAPVRGGFECRSPACC